MSDQDIKKSQDEANQTIPCKKRDRSASEERLINAGREMFSKYGFDGATTKMISKHADVNESLIGRYFDGKEGLLVAIIENFIGEMCDRQLSYQPQNTLTEELTRYLEDRIVNGQEHLDFAKIIFTQALVNKEFRRRVRETIPLQLDINLIQRVQLLADQNKLKPGSVVEEICREYDVYLDGLFFFELILHEKNVTDIITEAKKFIRRYASLFEA